MNWSIFALEFTRHSVLANEARGLATLSTLGVIPIIATHCYTTLEFVYVPGRICSRKEHTMAKQAVTKGAVAKTVPWAHLQEVIFDDFFGKKLSYEGFTIEKVAGGYQAVVDSDAVFVGWQKTSLGEPFPLYNITATHHPSIGSTVTDETLRKLRLLIPKTPALPPKLLRVENIPRFNKKIAPEG